MIFSVWIRTCHPLPKSFCGFPLCLEINRKSPLWPTWLLGSDIYSASDLVFLCMPFNSFDTSSTGRLSCSSNTPSLCLTQPFRSAVPSSRPARSGLCWNVTSSKRRCLSMLFYVHLNTYISASEVIFLKTQFIVCASWGQGLCLLLYSQGLYLCLGHSRRSVIVCWMTVWH